MYCNWVHCFISGRQLCEYRLRLGGSGGDGAVWLPIQQQWWHCLKGRGEISFWLNTEMIDSVVINLNCSF